MLEFNDYKTSQPTVDDKKESYNQLVEHELNNEKGRAFRVKKQVLEG